MGNYKRLIAIILVMVVIFMQTGCTKETAKELTPDEIREIETRIYELKRILFFDGAFEVKSDGTIEYTTIDRDAEDDALLNYGLYVYYLEMEEKGTPVERKTAEELWAEVSLETWEPTPGSYLESYYVWGYRHFNALVYDWGWHQSAVASCNRTLNRLHTDENNFNNYKFDWETMTPEEIVRFEEKYSEFEEKRDNIELTEEYLKEFTDWVKHGKEPVLIE